MWRHITPEKPKLLLQLLQDTTPSGIQIRKEGKAAEALIDKEHLGSIEINLIVMIELLETEQPRISGLIHPKIQKIIDDLNQALHKIQEITHESK